MARAGRIKWKQVRSLVIRFISKTCVLNERRYPMRVAYEQRCGGCATARLNDCL